MKCPNCGSEDWRLINYDLHTDEFVYECGYCGCIVHRSNNETITTNKSITNDKEHSNYYVNYNGSYKTSLIQGNLSPNEVKILADKITITERSIGITLDLSDKNCFDKVDSIVINGVKYVKK